MTGRLLLALALTFTLAACGDEPSSNGATAPAKAVSFAAKTDQPGAISVFDVRQKKEGDEVAVYGRVMDITHGFAAFTMIDEELEYCGQGNSEDDHCATPWDYCCVQKEAVVAGSIPVEFRDAKGEPIESEDTGLRRLDLVAVKGKLERTTSGGLVLVTTTGWFQRERPKMGDHVEWP